MAFYFTYTCSTRFYQALLELDIEGGVAARFKRYQENQRKLEQGMQKLAFKLVLDNTVEQSPIITTFLYPENEKFSFQAFYEALKASGFVIYPGKVSDLNCFRIGNIGEVYPADIDRLLVAIEQYCQKEL